MSTNIFSLFTCPQLYPLSTLSILASIYMHFPHLHSSPPPPTRIQLPLDSAPVYIQQHPPPTSLSTPLSSIQSASPPTSSSTHTCTLTHQASSQTHTCPSHTQSRSSPSSSIPTPTHTTPTHTPADPTVTKGELQAEECLVGQNKSIIQDGCVLLFIVMQMC